MGVYTEYLNRGLDFDAIQTERKKQLAAISTVRGRDIMVIAADMAKPQSSLDYGDILPVQDQLATLTGAEIDIIIETPGGLAEAAEDIISMIRARYGKVGMIVPGWAKSAGTIFVMAGDEILMGNASALGPIDGQILQANGKRFSAHAFLEGLDQIKSDVEKTGVLNKAYIPILQNISPGEIQHMQNAQAFSQKLVKDWLEKYKFKFWATRRTSGETVTEEYKRKRAEEIAKMLADQSRWLTHGRSIRIHELENDLKLQITDYTKEAGLNDAITRYHTLLRMSFELKPNMFKLYETPTSQIYRLTGNSDSPIHGAIPLGGLPPGVLPSGLIQTAKQLRCNLGCASCGCQFQLVANLEPNQATPPGCIPFPQYNVVKCPACNADIDVTKIRLQIEAQMGKKIL